MSLSRVVADIRRKALTLCHVGSMDRQPKRIPGERNPEGKGDAPMHVVRESYMGGNDYGIARGIIALVNWRKRRRAAKRR